MSFSATYHHHHHVHHHAHHFEYDGSVMKVVDEEARECS